MITVENLSFTYRKSKRVVLHDFSLAFESGRVYGLLGKNGAGKSTLLYLMSGLLTPKGGKVMFHDTDVRRRLPVTLQDMFLVPEEFELPPVSLVSYIELNSSFYPRFSKEDMIKYLHYFGYQPRFAFYGPEEKSIYELCTGNEYFAFAHGRTDERIGYSRKKPVP